MILIGMLLQEHTKHKHITNRQTHNAQRNTGVLCITLKCSFIWLNHTAVIVCEQGIDFCPSNFLWPKFKFSQSASFFCVSSGPYGLGRRAERGSLCFTWDTRSFTGSLSIFYVYDRTSLHPLYLYTLLQDNRDIISVLSSNASPQWPQQ